MTDRVQQVREIQRQALREQDQLLKSKRAKEAVTPSVMRKTGCNFCSHYRKKFIDGISKVKQSLLGK